MLVTGWALAGLALGALLPQLLRRLPDRPDRRAEADELVLDGPLSPVLRPATYAELAQWRWARPVLCVASAVVLGVLAARPGWSAAFPAYAYAGVIGVLLAYVDLRARRLPDLLTLPSYLLCALLLLVAAVVDDRFDALLHAMLGAAAMLVVYLALVLANPRGMGLGDVKLAGLLGLLLGWFGLSTWVLGLCAGFLLGGLVGVVLLAARRVSLKSALPFGPMMLTGALVALVATG